MRCGGSIECENLFQMSIGVGREGEIYLYNITVTFKEIF